MKKFIYPYKMGSKSVNNLKGPLGAKIIKVDGTSKFKGSASTLVINWGSSKENKELEKCTVLNTPEVVAKATNKLSFFEAVKDKVNIPEFTTDKELVKKWINDGHCVLSREKLSGHSGDGIIILDCVETMDNYDLGKGKVFVKYIPKKTEYRVHVVQGKVIDVQQKVKKKDAMIVEWKIRSHKNGFIFQRENISPHGDVLNQAIAAIKEIGLDFGAVDVIWNNHRKKAYVLEINSAPGLEGSSVENYTKALEEAVKNKADPSAKLIYEFYSEDFMNIEKPIQLNKVAKAYNEGVWKPVEADPWDE